jgi:hypothetical protein
MKAIRSPEASTMFHQSHTSQGTVFFVSGYGMLFNPIDSWVLSDACSATFITESHAFSPYTKFSFIFPILF